MVGIFGSYSRNEQKPESDLDIIIDFQTTIDLLNLIGIEQELSEKLGIKVDLITLKSINPKLLGYIQKDLIRIV
ncbi:MAG TPA: nucleotidyltransferase family protein [Bacteroidia bacterium]|nr:nucleotidyltransferase family protein [Bacteroidia bacterium]